MQATASKEIDLAFSYAQKYWDAGNLTITLMFGVAFGIYVLLAQYEAIRNLVAKYWGYVLGISFLGNLALGVAVWRFGHNEMLLLEKLTSDQTVLEAIYSGVELRWGLLAGNFVIYATVIALVANFADRNKRI